MNAFDYTETFILLTHTITLVLIHSFKFTKVFLGYLRVLFYVYFCSTDAFSFVSDFSLTVLFCYTYEYAQFSHMHLHILFHVKLYLHVRLHLPLNIVFLFQIMNSIVNIHFIHVIFQRMETLVHLN